MYWENKICAIRVSTIKIVPKNHILNIIVFHNTPFGSPPSYCGTYYRVVLTIFCRSTSEIADYGSTFDDF